MSSNKKVIIHYLFHSGFTVEYGDYFLVFDYYPPPDGTLIPEFSEKDIADKVIGYSYPFVFISHSHHDHFSPEVFDWKKYNPSLTYIMSDDVQQADYDNYKHLGVDYVYMSPYDNVEKNGLAVSTFGSTDIGVSFLLTVGKLQIFHAGDLNWWHWADESTKQELADEERKFKAEAARIEGERIDILFFPVDPRLGEHYFIGGAYMLETLQPRLFVPMHFGEDNLITHRFADRMRSTGVPVAEITHKGQKFEYDL